MSTSLGSRVLVVAAFVFGLVAGVAVEPARQGPNSSQTLAGQTPTEADAKSAGCVTCHTATDEASMHPTSSTGTVRLGCADCHGGDVSVRVPQNASAGDAAY